MKHLLVWTLAVALLISTGTRAARAHAQRTQSGAALALITKQADELVRLRNTAEESLTLRPEGGLAAKASQALSRSGLASSLMQSLSPGADASDKGLIRQRVTLTLSGITLPQLGKFLDAWRTGEPYWVISELDLSPSGTDAPGADLPLRAVVTIDGLFKDRPRTIPHRGTSP